MIVAMTIQYLIGNPAQLPNRSDTPFSLVPLDDCTAQTPTEKLALPSPIIMGWRVMSWVQDPPIGSGAY